MQAATVTPIPNGIADNFIADSSAETACTASGVAYTEAISVCQILDGSPRHSDCLYDYCAMGGNAGGGASIATNIATSAAQAATEDTTTPVVLPSSPKVDLPFPTCGDKNGPYSQPNDGNAVSDAECGSGYEYNAANQNVSCSSVFTTGHYECAVSTVGEGDHTLCCKGLSCTFSWSNLPHGAKGTSCAAGQRIGSGQRCTVEKLGYTCESQTCLLGELHPPRPSCTEQPSVGVHSVVVTPPTGSTVPVGHPFSVSSDDSSAVLTYELIGDGEAYFSYYLGADLFPSVGKYTMKVPKAKPNPS